MRAAPVLLPRSLEVLRCNFCCRASLRLRFCGRGALLIRLSTCRVGSYAGACSETAVDYSLRLPARLWRWRRMTGHRLIRRLEAERLEKPATTSKTPQNAQTSLVVGLPGAPSLQQGDWTNRRVKATGVALWTRLWPRDVAGRGARAVTHTAKGSEQRAHSSSQRDCTLSQSPGRRARGLFVASRSA